MYNIQRSDARKVHLPSGTVHLKLIDTYEFEFYSEWPRKNDDFYKHETSYNEWITKIGDSLNNVLDSLAEPQAGDLHRLRHSDFLMEIKYAQGDKIRDAQSKLA
jgi:hypothetical protein